MSRWLRNTFEKIRKWKNRDCAACCVARSSPFRPRVRTISRLARSEPKWRTGTLDTLDLGCTGYYWCIQRWAKYRVGHILVFRNKKRKYVGFIGKYTLVHVLTVFRRVFWDWVLYFAHNWRVKDVCSHVGIASSRFWNETSIMADANPSLLCIWRLHGALLFVVERARSKMLPGT